MLSLPTLLLLALLASAAIAAFAYLKLRARGLDQWLAPYVAQRLRRSRHGSAQPIHLILCIADHYEPKHGGADPAQAARRVENWVTQYPRLFARFKDSDARPPRHTFFFPIDEYEPSHVDPIAALCRAGFGEVELHHHHDNDTADALRQRLLAFVKLFRERHGLLPQDRHTGAVKYGFVHGNWSLDNSRPDGRWCGVNNELDVLRETGCYADFTMPSAPSRTQTRKINSIYYATDDPLRPKSHDRGVDAGNGQPPPPNALLLIQGPLMLDWRNAAGQWRPTPRIENANLQGNQPPTTQRLDLWLKARVQIPTRPDWYFVKLHTHGATEPNQAVLLGDPMTQFHQSLAARAAQDPNFHYHYVTAREMYNLVKAAEAGHTGSVADARDYELVWPK